MRKFVIEGKTVSVYPGKEENCPIVYLNTCAEEGGQVYQAVKAGGCADFSLAVVSGLNWNHDMVPWDALPISGNGIPFTAGADDYLRLLTEEIMPKTERELPGTVLWRGLAGYSLAGLFAFYAPYRTEFFSRIASISGSLWFPGFQEYVFSNVMKRKPDCLYLSLGDKECRTKNSYLRTVQERTEQIAAFCRNEGIDTAFHLNPGNHFQHGVRRTAAGIAWLLTGKKSDQNENRHIAESLRYP